jgi:hypothetical protein
MIFFQIWIRYFFVSLLTGIQQEKFSRSKFATLHFTFKKILGAPGGWAAIATPCLDEGDEVVLDVVISAGGGRLSLLGGVLVYAAKAVILLQGAGPLLRVHALAPLQKGLPTKTADN